MQKGLKSFDFYLCWSKQFYVNEKAAMFYRPLIEDDQSPGAHICWEGSLTDILNDDMIYTIKVEGNAVCHTKSLGRAFVTRSGLWGPKRAFLKIELL